MLHWLNCICCDIFQCSKFFHHHIDLHIITSTCILSVPNRWNIKDYVLWTLSMLPSAASSYFRKIFNHLSMKTSRLAREMYSVLCQDGKTNCNMQIFDSGFMWVISVTFTGTFFTVTKKQTTFQKLPGGFTRG